LNQSSDSALTEISVPKGTGLMKGNKPQPKILLSPYKNNSYFKGKKKERKKQKEKKIKKFFTLKESREHHMGEDSGIQMK
jgi:hypothetical protein